MIPAVHEICAGLDVHRKTISATVIKALPNEEPIISFREFSAFTPGLFELANWLKEHDSNVVAMESSGVYWIPVHHVLKETGLSPYVVNPHHVKAIKGKKTDRKDSKRIAHVYQHGLVRHSFIPEGAVRELRHLTRARVRIVNVIRSFKNNTTRILDEANIKISAVASDLFGVSGQLMLKALTNNPKTAPAVLSLLARGKLKKKQEQLTQALTGFLTPIHIDILKSNMQFLYMFKNRLSDLDQKIVAMCNNETLKPAFDILKSIPGIKDVAAAAILAEIGNDMSFFPSAANLASWAALCPGSNVSAGKSYSSRIGKGNRYFRRILVQVAWAASHTKDTPFSGYYFRMAKKKGKNRAIVALAHKILRIIYACLSKSEEFDQNKFRGTQQNTVNTTVSNPPKNEPAEMTDLFGASDLLESAIESDDAMLEKVETLLAAFPVISNAEPNAPETSISSMNNNLPVTDSPDISFNENRNVNINASDDAPIPSESIDKPPNKKRGRKRKTDLIAN